MSLKGGKPICDLCHKAMHAIRENEDGDQCWPYEHAHAHICNQCWDLAWSEGFARDKPCQTMCETRPCKRGNDCWYTPDAMRNLPYETYFADRIGCENCTPGYVAPEPAEIEVSKEEFAEAVSNFCESDLSAILRSHCGVEIGEKVARMLPFEKEDLCVAMLDGLQERIKEAQGEV